MKRPNTIAGAQLGRRRAFILILLIALTTAASACSFDDKEHGDDDFGPSNNSSGGWNSAPGAPDAGVADPESNNDRGDHVPEQEEEFEFSAPAVIGDHVYVANETLNSVAIIDSRNLSITTQLVGVEPTDIVGPDPERAQPADEARVMVLNRGSHSVSILDGDPIASHDAQRPVTSVPVGAHSNRIAMEPTGESAVVWYDPDTAEEGRSAGDLSAVSVVREGKSYQISVGFHVRKVAFDDAGTRALILSDDGLSLIEFSELSQDAIAAPKPLVPADYQSTRPEDLEVIFTPDGKWALTRSANFWGATLMEVDSGQIDFLALPEIPTDIDLIDAARPEVLLMLREHQKALRLSIPDGFRAAADAIEIPQPSPIVTLSGDAGFPIDAGPAPDAGPFPDAGPTYDAGPAPDAGPFPDAGPTYDAGPAPDAGPFPDAGPTDDAGPAQDAGPTQDIGYDPDTSWDVSDEDSWDVSGEDVIAPNEDAGPPPEANFPEDIDGFEIIDLIAPGMGAATVSQNGEHALLYTTLNEEKRAILLDLTLDPAEEDAQRLLVFEKGIRGALSDRDGRTFLVFHTKLPGDVPVGATPADPEYIERSWGVSVVDVTSAATRLVLTQHEPGQAVLYTPQNQGDDDAGQSGQSAAARVFMISKVPASTSSADADPTRRDVLTVNLRTFRTDYFRVPSLPDGIGLVPEARRAWISQRHDQGRMTFVDVETNARQTITGYQLNAGIR